MSLSQQVYPVGCIQVTVLSAALDGRRERLRVAGGYPGGKNADKRAGENQAPGSKVTGKNADRLHAMDGQESTCPGCADAMSLCSCEEVDGTASAPGSIVSDESADGNPCSAVDTVIAVVQATLPKTYDANDVRFFLTGAAAAQRRRSVPAVTTPPSSGKPPSGPSVSTPPAWCLFASTGHHGTFSACLFLDAQRGTVQDQEYRY